MICRTIEVMAAQCAVTSCEREARSRGWCSAHHKRWLANGDLQEAVPIGSSLRVRMRGLKTHCPHGHEYTTDNTYTDPRGKRRCRTCRKIEWTARR